MIDNEDHVYLSEYCFDVCDVLETVIRGKDTDDLHESVREAIEDLERFVDWLWFYLLPYQATSG